MQDDAFQVSLRVPRPDIALTSPSAFDPSHLQNGIGAASTIQFPHWMSGIGGKNHAGIGGHAQIAVPIPSVNVGVTKIRKKVE